MGSLSARLVGASAAGLRLLSITLAVILTVVGSADADNADDWPWEITAPPTQSRPEKPLQRIRHSDGLLLLDVSVPEFVALQHLDAHGRRQLLGLPWHCSPTITAMRLPTSPGGRLVALITCSARPQR